MAQNYNQSQSCFKRIPYDDVNSKPKYKIGVLAIEGEETAFSTYNATFADYLSSTAGKRFDPPIAFEMVAVDFDEFVYDKSNDPLDKKFDFLFVNPQKTSCIESQFGTQSLASIVFSTTADGKDVDLSEFAGLIITKADNDDIDTLTDLKNKKVAAISIADFGSGLMQFYEMKKKGMSYINDPAQLVFTGAQDDVILGVLNGTFDAGFIRTGIIERTVDGEGKLVDPSKIKIIDSRQDMTSSGIVFPYEHSTPLYPEWNFVATKMTPPEISREVQAALLSIARQGKTGMIIDSCLRTPINNSTQCNDLTVQDPEASCDISLETALAASRALSNGKYAGWRTTLSYDRVQKVLYDTGNLKNDPMSRELICDPTNDLYEKVNCPTGYFKLSKEVFRDACENVGLGCPEGSECICRPCFQALPLKVAPLSVYEPGKGCKEFDICGTMTQNEVLNFTITDNLELTDGLNLQVIAFEGEDEREIAVVPGPNPNQYTISLRSSQVGLMLLKIYDGEEQIDASPLRVQVIHRACPRMQVAGEDGACRCVESAISIFGSCVGTQIIWIAIVVPFLVVFVMSTLYYLQRKNREADSLWLVNRSEIVYSEPLKVIGKGSFGSVVLAEYRGSKVAVKKALPMSNSTSFLSWVFNKSSDDDDASVNTHASNVTLPIPGSSFTGRSKRLDLDLELGQESSHNLRSIELLEQPPGTAENPRVAFARKVDSAPVQNGSEDKQVGKSWAKQALLMTNRPASLAKMKREFIHEVRLLSRLRHPNITTIMGAVIEKGTQPLMITEYMEHGSLQQVLLNPSIIMEAELIHSILKDIAQGLRFLHSSIPPVIHGDLKSGNVLIDSKLRAKLSEFGLSRRKAKQATGTPLWMAPELLKGRTLNTTKSDMYSVGIMMNEVFSRKEPYSEFADESSEELLEDIVDGKTNRRPVVPAHCPVKAKKLLQFLWHHDPKLRPSAIELDNRLREMDDGIFEPIAQASKSHRLHENKHQGNSENFLYQAFPKHVAEVLAAGGKVEPETHEVVTIFFSDIVGFTTIAANFDPLKVSQMLDRLYLKFDDLARKHELFKIETIGDAYMCAGNLATDQHDDHVKRIALFAKEAIEAASETLVDEDDPSAGYIKIRVGFHSGPVVSNVVGNLNPRYGVFGDTVNVASRMESSSEVGKIHCSKASAKLMKKQAPELSMELRGRTAIKGKGFMTTYWVK